MVKEKRTRNLNIRMSDDEWKLTHRKAEEFFEGNVSLLIRAAVKSFRNREESDYSRLILGRDRSQR